MLFRSVFLVNPPKKLMIPVRQPIQHPKGFENHVTNLLNPFSAPGRIRQFGFILSTMSYLESMPKTLRWVLQVGGIFLLLFTLFRATVFIAFRPDELSFAEALPSFVWGIRYDLRWIAGMLLPVTLIGIRPQWSPFFSERNKRFWTT